MRVRSIFCAVVPLLAVVLAPPAAHAVAINVSCNSRVVGAINVTANGAGISGGFTSSVGGPPGTLAAAAAACNETQFNWYQIVTATNGAYQNRQGANLTPPFIDPPLNGLSVAQDPTWADNMPWYWDMYAPTAGTPNYDAAYQLSNNTTAGTLNFADYPGGPAGRTVSFNTWLVSLNANGSFQAFDGGFTWNWAQATNSVTGIAALAGNPTAAQYQNIIAGFATRVPEPASMTLLAGGMLMLAGMARRTRR
jgi:hypothetical protein